MSLVHEIRNMRVKKLIDDERDYTFPDFMRVIRKTLGLSRKDVTDMVQVSEAKLFQLEHGKILDKDFPISLSHLYGIDCELIMNKLKDYLEK